MLPIPRSYRLVGLLAGGVLLSGCGASVVVKTPVTPLQTVTKTSRTHKRPLASSAVTSAVLANRVPTPTPYRSTSVISPKTGSGHEVFSAPLVPGTGADTITVTVTRQGHGQLTVTSASGHTLWTLSHVQWAGTLEFRQHPPVLMTQAEENFCGTGGCAFTAYTYDPQTKHLAPVPFSPWNAPIYRYNAATRSWTLHMNSNHLTKAAASFLGWGKLTASGFASDTRTYNALNGHVFLTYQYAAVAGSATGEWIPVGSERFSPTAPYPGYTTHISNTSALAMYLTAAIEDAPTLAAQLVSSPTVADRLWQTVTPLKTLGIAGQVNPTPLPDAGRPNDIGEVVYGTLGSGPATHLEGFVADAAFTAVDGSARLSRLSLSPIALKVTTVPQVLERLQMDPAVATWFKAHPTGDLSISSMGTQWDLTYSNGKSGSVDAVTGTVHGTP